MATTIQHERHMTSSDELEDDFLKGEPPECHVTVENDPTSTGSTVTSQPCDSGHERLIEKKTVSNGVQHCRASNPPNYLWFAIIVTICNCPFGCLGVIFALLSRSSFQKRQYKEAKTQGNVAKWLSIVGVAVSFVAIAILLVYFLCINKRIVNTISELQEEIKNM